MTHEEIEEAWERLHRIAVLEKDGTVTDRETTIVASLKDLALDVGVWRPNLVGNSNEDKTQLFQNIHQALQTASMIDACRTAAKNVEIAEGAQRAASRAQQAAFWSMLAAWGAVVVNIVVAYIMAAKS